MKNTFKNRVLLLITIGSLIPLTSCTSKNLSQADIKESTQKQALLYSPTPTVSPTSTPFITTPVPLPTISPEKAKEAEDLYEQGFSLYNEFKYHEAIKYFDKAIEVDKESYKAYNGKGIAMCFLGNYSDGIAFIEKALDIHPNYAYANFNMAMAYKLQKDYPNALLWFNKSIAIDPNDTWSYYGISTIYADWKDVPKALEYLKKAIDLDASVKEVAKQQDHYMEFTSNPEFLKLVN